MIEFPLQLRRRDPSEASKDGWLLPGDDVAQWVRWLCRGMGAAADEVRLLPMPAAAGNRAATGLFVVGRAAHEVAGRAIPYRRLGGRLFVPADAELRYPLTETELASLFRQDVNVLHPRIGLVSADHEELLRLADLLALPSAPKRRWNCAHIGLNPLPDRLRFGVIVPPTPLEDLLERGHEDIGSRQPNELPSSTGESKPGLAQGIRNAVHDAILSFTRRVPDASQRRTWVNRLEDWANSKLGDLADRRQREIDRLLDLLRRDPDQGLRHAVPIGGDNSHRGRSAPGASLPERPVDFDLRDLAGGGAADPWDLRWEQMQALGEMYRQTADRELALRRFRRAAYIYAKLLNDYESAAAALQQGGYFREAAALYRKRLSADKTAAECLRAGGLYEEAAALYEELGELELLGDMYRELDRGAEADEAYEGAVRAHLSQHQFIKAAHLIDQKLRDAPRARRLLWSTWPGTADGLEEYFRLLQRDDESEEAMKSMRRLAEKAESLEQRIVLGELFGKVHERFVDEDVTAESADLTRVLLGDYLRGNGPRVEDATRILHSLDRGDRLLERDARAFARTRLRTRPDPSRPAMLPTNQPVRLEPAGRENLGRLRIHQAVQCQWGTVLLGLEGDKPTARLLGSGTIEQWFPAAEWQVFDAVFASAEVEPRPGILHVCSNVELEPRSIRVGSEELRIINRAYVSTDVDSAGRRYACGAGELYGQGILRRFTNDQLDATADFSFPADPFAESDSQMFMPMRATRRSVYLGAANSLLRLQGRNRGRVELPARALSMVCREGHPVSRLMFHMEFGAGLFRDDDMRWDKVRYFASDMSEPRVDFLRTGHLLAANRDLIRIYVVGRYEISRVAEIPGPGDRVIGVLPGPGAHSFRVITEQQVLAFRMKSA